VNEGDKDKTDDHQEQPRAIFAEVDKLPAMPLMGIDPYVGEGAYVFRGPDEESDQTKAEQQWHTPLLSIRAKVNPCGTEGNRDKYKEQIARIGDEVVGEEIGVDEDGQSCCKFCVGIARVSHVHDARGAGQIAADRCIHEPGEERHMADPEEIAFGIDPGADVGLEDFHYGADDMEDEDDFCFADGLHAQKEQERLHGEGGQKQKIVSRQPCVRWPVPFRQQHEGQDDSAEETGPGLLETKETEFPEKSIHPAGGSMVFKPDTDFVETGFGIGEHRFYLILKPDPTLIASFQAAISTEEA
jgi:hypothetical protein